MNQKSLITLGVAAAAVALVAGIMTISGNKPAPVTATGGPVIPGLLDKVNDAHRVTITTATETITISREGDAWFYEPMYGYPARFDNIRTLLLEVANLTKIEPRTSNPDLYARIQVEDIDTPNAQSRLVEVFADSGQRIGAVLVGNTRFDQGMGRTQSTFVRIPGEPQSWLASGSVNINTMSSHWVDTQFMSIQSNRVQRVEIVHADGETVLINKPDPNQSNFDLGTLPQGREVTSPTRPNELAGVLASLRFDEVRPATEIDADRQPLATLTLDEKEGLRIVAQLYNLEDGRWFQFVAFPDEERIERVNEQRRTEAAESGDDESPAEEPVLILIESVREEADTINARVAGWEYRLPAFSADRFLRRNDYYLKPLEDPNAPSMDDDEEWMTDQPLDLGSQDIDPETMRRIQEAINQMMENEGDVTSESLMDLLSGEESSEPAVQIDDIDLVPVPVE